MSTLTVFSDGTEVEEVVRCTVDKECREVCHLATDSGGLSGNVLPRVEWPAYHISRRIPP